MSGRLKIDPYKAATAARAKAMERVVFTIDADKISRFDNWAADTGYASRAEALRDLVDGALEAEAAP